MNYKECICCNSKERRVISRIGRNFKKLSTVICTGCGLIHSDPIPSKKELNKFYKENYRIKYKHSYHPHIRHTIRYAPGCLNLIKDILSYCHFNDYKNKRFLDIGSGSGEVLYFAKKFGLEAEGIEPNIGYAEFSKNVLKLKITNSSYENAQLEKNSYDIINLNQVLEHLPNPLKVLDDLHNYLKPNGILALTVPDIEARLHSPNNIFHYAHIFNYNHLTLKKIFDKSGFQILNGDTKSTQIFAKKVNEHDNSSITFDFKKNYQNIISILQQNKYSKHYSSKVPYLRFMRKCYQYPKEIILSFFFTSHKKVLDKVYSDQF
jgi:2-polyprenyl-3-methyl-5-hydroxy-6-metoxy-1,4-benzoquinol methylase